MRRPFARRASFLFSAVCASLLAGALVVPAIADEVASDVVFVIGDYSRDEGGEWRLADSPIRGPFGIDFDRDDRLYLVELTSGRIHRVDGEDESETGQLVTLSDAKPKGFAGDGGPLKDALFNGPHNCVVADGRALLVSDSWNHCVRSIDLDTLQVETIAGTGEAGFSGDGGDAVNARFDYVMCIALDPAGRTIHIADLKNRRVRNVDRSTGIVETVCGNGQRGVPVDGSQAKNSPLIDPRAVASDADGNLYVLERGGHALRVVRPDGTIRTVAGTGEKGFHDGAALESRFASPKHICCDPVGRVYIADDLNGAIRRYDPSTELVSTILGRGIGDARIELLHPHGVRWHKGWLYVLDTGQHRVIKVRCP